MGRIAKKKTWFLVWLLQWYVLARFKTEDEDPGEFWVFGKPADVHLSEFQLANYSLDQNALFYFLHFSLSIQSLSFFKTDFRV